MVFIGLYQDLQLSHGLHFKLSNIAVVSDLLKSIMPSHRSKTLVLDVSSNQVPLHRLLIWLLQSLTVWSNAMPFSNCGFSYPLSMDLFQSAKFYSWTYFSPPIHWICFNLTKFNGSISIRKIPWVSLNPIHISYNALLGLLQPDNK